MLSFGAISSTVQSDSMPNITVIPEVPALEPVTVPTVPTTTPTTTPLESPVVPVTTPTTSPSPVPETPSTVPTAPVEAPENMSDDGIDPEKIKQFFVSHPDILKRIKDGIDKGLVTE